jgi:hypothetical protein
MKRNARRNFSLLSGHYYSRMDSEALSASLLFHRKEEESIATGT